MDLCQIILRKQYHLFVLHLQELHKTKELHSYYQDRKTVLIYFLPLRLLSIRTVGYVYFLLLRLLLLLLLSDMYLSLIHI